MDVRIDVTQIAGGPETDAPCSRHEGNSAVASCSRCGKFICGLCRTEADGRIFCPACFDRLTAEGDLASTASRIRNWLGISIALPVLSFFFWWTGIVPLVSTIGGIYCCVRGLKDKHARDEPDGIAGLYVMLILHILIIVGGIFLAAVFFGRMF